MKTLKKYVLSLLVVAGAALSSCTDLDEKMHSALERSATDDVNAGELLISAYSSLNGTHQMGRRWGLNELSTDAAIAPTRGGDWDDGGVHRAIHMHTWTADNAYMNDVFSDLHTAQFQASNVLRVGGATAQQKAEARFIRAFAMYDVLNLWGFALHREDLEDFRKTPILMPAQQAIAFIQTELEQIITDLPAFDRTKAYVASKHAARFLLMKLHLNKGAFLNRKKPDFPVADMNRVVELARAIKDDPRGLELSVGAGYYDSFAPNNDQISTENIFTLYNENGVRGGSVNNARRVVSHYNMNPSGWNGWCTLGAFYDLFEAGDVRRGLAYNGYVGAGNMTNPGNRINVGFMIGQQYDLFTDDPLEARNPAGYPLSFTKGITLRTSGDTLETAGIRVAKYAFDYVSPIAQGNNDWVLFRYADVLLMEAEAILRGATNGTTPALDLVNAVRAARSAGAPFATLTEGNLLAERGRELYWEGWRREDLIRFGKFLEPNEVRTTKSSENALLFAVPSQQLAVNPNLKQNEGY